jgi:hypothetical protein
LTCKVAEQSASVRSSSAEIIDFVSVTHDVVLLSSAPCQELQSMFKKVRECESVRV